MRLLGPVDFTLEGEGLNADALTLNCMSVNLSGVGSQTIYLVPPLFAAWTMAKSRRALLSEMWGWLAAVALGLLMGLVDLNMFVAWPDFVDIDVVWREEPSVVLFAIPIASAALTSLGLRIAAALRYARLHRAR